jgi:hypothetical protein
MTPLQKQQHRDRAQALGAIATNIARAKQAGDWQAVERHTEVWHRLNEQSPGQAAVAGLTKRLAKANAARLAPIPLTERAQRGQEDFESRTS